MGFVAESWFIDAFQDHFDDFLHQLIVPGLDTERTLLIAVFLRNIDPLCRLWTVTVISQRRDDLIDFLVTHAINRRSIGSGGHTSVVGVYRFRYSLLNLYNSSLDFSAKLFNTSVGFLMPLACSFLSWYFQ